MQPDPNGDTNGAWWKSERTFFKPFRRERMCVCVRVCVGGSREMEEIEKNQVAERGRQR